MSTLQRLTQPIAEPVSLDALKRQLRIDVADLTEDAHLNQINLAARQFCEDLCDRSFGEQTWRRYLDDWPANNGAIKLGRPPIKSVESIKYYGSDGTEYTLIANTDYLVSLPQGRIVPAYGTTWPITILRPIDAIWIDFTAGAGTTAQEIQAILLAATWLYVHRGDDPHDMDETTMRAIKALIGAGVPFI